jgi:hypothetical protein
MAAPRSHLDAYPDAPIVSVIDGAIVLSVMGVDDAFTPEAAAELAQRLIAALKAPSSSRPRLYGSIEPVHECA